MYSLRPSLGRDGVARGHVLDLGRDLVASKREVLARVRHVRGLGNRLLEGRGVLVLDDGVRESRLLVEAKTPEAVIGCAQESSRAWPARPGPLCISLRGVLRFFVA